ncbi:MAG: cytochrome ubiquinol oxidase subunit I [Nitrospirae bacterium]|nr:cytochrome ubiquinol oxidase subunit I [Nitrospirota bacterium]
MTNLGEHRRWIAGLLRGRGSLIAQLVLLIGLLSIPALGLAQETSSASAAVAYRDLPQLGGSRNLVWIVAQIHLLFAGFVLGVPIFAWVCEVIGVRTGDPRYDKLAKEFTKLLTAAYSTTALFGAILLFALIAFYPRFMGVLSDVFYASYLAYAALFLLETVTLYLYWYGWDSMQDRKGLHLTLGFLLNALGFFLMMIANGWATFQNSPVVLPENLTGWERAWAGINNPTFWPLNIHRVIGNVVLGGFICGAYAGIRYLSATTAEERVHYDWMGYVGNFIGVFGLLPLPFAGYWLTMEIYRYNQQMGITLMGGFLSWLFIIQAVLIGVLFLGSNYYFWLGLAYRTEGAERHKKIILLMLIVLLLCFGVWMTPHSLVASLQEARAIGGTHHPVLSVLGVMSAKMTAVNLMILISFASFLLYWRANKVETVSWAKGARVAQVGMIVLGALYLLWSGVYGYFVPAVVRVYVLSVSQVLVVLAVLILVTVISILSMRNARESGVLRWGRIPPRASYALVLNALMVILLMSLMGYARSSSRVHWHIYGLLEDTSPYAFSPALGEASAVMASCAFIFCLIVSFIFWVASLPSEKASGFEKAEPASAVVAGELTAR